VVGDIYRAGEIPLAGDLTAASFGKLARRPAEAEPASVPYEREDLASAVMGLSGENVALICCGLAAAAQVQKIVFAGSTLRDNPALWTVLAGSAAALGREPVLLHEGEFAGALGALELAAG
jgi:type II pantothenate kinase